MVASVRGLGAWERAYLLSASYAKAFDGLANRGLPYEADFLRGAMAAYAAARPALGHKAAKLRPRLRRGIRRYARRTGAWGTTVLLSLLYG
ncbi:hypothetical protein J8J27_27665, partial [Mycobacterium tuberculosis]|nr:hypothetical protein [Mycobacterium tuberculosis]